MYLNAVMSSGLSNYGLGRDYPENVRNTIRNIGSRLDELMASTMSLPADMQKDAAFYIRSLNSRLVNDIILRTDEISDADAEQKLLDITKEMKAIERIYFEKAGVAIKAAEAVPSVAGEAIIPAADAKALSAQYRTTFESYGNLYPRYSAVRPMIAKMAAFPMVGPMFAAVIAGIDARLKTLETDQLNVDQGFKKMNEVLAQGVSAVRFDRPIYDKMRNWVAGVMSLDSAMTRFEGEFLKKSAPATVSLPLIGEVSKPAAIAIGVSAVTALGTGVYFLIRSMKPARRVSMAPGVAGYRRRRRK